MKKFSELTEGTFNDALRHRARPPKGAERPSAQERYDHHKKQALHHLDLLKKQINNVPAGRLHWGHVGSMEEVHHRLRDLVNSGHAG